MKITALVAWYKIVKLFSPDAGKRRVWARLHAMDAEIIQLRDEKAKLERELLSRDRQITEVARQRDDALSHGRSLMVQLDTAIRANTINAQAYHFVMPERPIYDEDDVATVPVPKLTDDDLKRLLEEAPTMPLAQVETDATPTQVVHPMPTESGSEVTAERSYVITTIIPSPSLTWRGVGFHGPEFSDPTHIPTRVPTHVLGRLR